MVTITTAIIATGVILAVIVITIIIFIWWIRIRRIKKRTPNVDVEKISELHQLNYDPLSIERRENRFNGKGNEGGGVREIEKGVAGSEESQRIDSEIQWIREQIRREREARNGGGSGGREGYSRESHREPPINSRESGKGGNYYQGYFGKS